jgi:hypothetical protein
MLLPVHPTFGFTERAVAIILARKNIQHTLILPEIWSRQIVPFCEIVEQDARIQV